MKWLRLLFIGRLSRTNYVISFSFLIFLLFLAYSLIILIPIILGINEVPSSFYTIIDCLYILLLFLVFTLHARRWHDLGRSGWLTLLFLIPLIDIGVLLYLLFAPGDEEEYKYGNPQNPKSFDLVAIFLPKAQSTQDDSKTNVTTSSNSSDNVNSSNDVRG